MCVYVREVRVCIRALMPCMRTCAYVCICEGFTCVYVKALRVYMSNTSPCIATILDGMQAVPPDHPVTPVGRRALEYYGYLLASFLDRPTLLPRPFARCVYVFVCTMCACTFLYLFAHWHEVGYAWCVSCDVCFTRVFVCFTHVLVCAFVILCCPCTRALVCGQGNRTFFQLLTDLLYTHLRLTNVAKP